MSTIVEYKAKETKGIVLNANENYRDLPLDLKKEIADRIMNIEFNRYPDDDANEVCEKYAKYIHKSKENLIVGNGSDEIKAVADYVTDGVDEDGLYKAFVNLGLI